MSTDRSSKTSKLIKQLGDTILPIAGLMPGLKELSETAKRVIEILDEKRSERIELFCKALIEGNLTSENLHNKENPGYEIEFGDLLQACMNDSDSSKAESYAQLTLALRFGELDKETRRHFVFSLKQLSFDDIELLRRAFIASTHEIVALVGSTIMSQADVLENKNMSAIQVLSTNTLKQLGLSSEKGITKLGYEFIKATHRRVRLTPESMSLKVWQSPPVAIFTTATHDCLHDKIIEEFKKIRIRCERIRIDNFSSIEKNADKYKGLILAGNYEGIIYSHSESIARYNSSHHYQFVSYGHSLPHRHDISLRLSLRELDNLQEKVRATAKSFEFITDEN